MNLINLDLKESPDTCLVVRVKTSYYSSPRGIHTRTDILFLKRKTTADWNLLKEDADGGGVDNVFSRITNLNECQDGIYEVITCNEHRDYWSGYIEDYDYMLIPYEENPTQAQDAPAI